MRIEREEFLENIQLDEIMDKGLLDIKKKMYGKGRAEYTFTMKGNTPRMNEYPEDINYTVKFFPIKKKAVAVTDKSIFGKELQINLFTTSLIFSNDVSNMSPLGGKDGYMTLNKGYAPDIVYSATTLFGTIARILIDYCDHTNPKIVQGLSFCTAGPHLVKPYIILCKEASRKGDYKWLNPVRWREGMTGMSCDLIRNDVYKSILEDLKNR